MTDEKETRMGRPPNGDYPRKVFARISDEHYEYLVANCDSISDGIRAAIECLIERDTRRPPE